MHDLIWPLNQRFHNGGEMTKKNSNVPIFVSSTYSDLSDYRREAEDSILALEQSILGMEYFTASPDEPLEVCLKNVRKSSLFILIVGTRYGSLTDSGKSFTEREYDCAIENNIPVLPFIIKDGAVIPYHEDSHESDESVKKLKRFKEKIVTNHTPAYFESPKDLAAKVSQAIPKELEQLGESVNKEQLKLLKRYNDGIALFQRFVLMPLMFNNKEIELRLRIIKGFNGGKIKAEVFSAIGVPLGRSIVSTVRVIGDGTEIVDDDNLSIQLFASEEQALTLLDNGVSIGDIITVKVETKCGTAYGVAAGTPRETLLTGLVMKELLSVDSSQRGYYIAQKPKSKQNMSDIINQLISVFDAGIY